MALISFVSISSHIPDVPKDLAEIRLDQKRVRSRELLFLGPNFRGRFPFADRGVRKEMKADYFGQKSLDYDFKSFYPRRVYKTS